MLDAAIRVGTAAYPVPPADPVIPMTKTARRTVAPALALCLLAGVPGAAAAQSAADILDRATELYEQRMEGIENYTIVQSMEDGPPLPGGAGTVYFERTMVDGRAVFVPRGAMGDSLMAMQDQAGAMEDAGSMFRKLQDRATVRGEETIEGHATWLIHVDDASGLDWGAEQAENVTMKTLTMAIDQADYVVRRMVIEGDMYVEGETRPVTMTTTLSDYRTVEGMLHPFRTEMNVSGMTGAMSAQERAELMATLEQARRQLAEMPEAQRAMAERMMGGQLERMEEMLMSDAFVMAFVVDEVRVNQGPPSGD